MDSSQSGGFFNQSKGQAFGDGSQTDDRAPTLYSFRCVSASQLNSAQVDSPDAVTINLDGAPLSHVKIAGFVRKVESKETSNLYIVDDGTGLVSLTHWKNDDLPAASEGDLCAFYCAVRVFNNKGQFTLIRYEQGIALEALLAHEVAVLRQHLHFTGELPLNQDKPQGSQVFVESNALDDSVLDLLRTHRDKEEGLAPAFIASELKANETAVRNSLNNHEEGGRIHQEAGLFRIN